jgi:paraquat-inducible protein B
MATDNKQSTQTDGSLPEVAVKSSRSFSMVWLIPLVATVIGGWLLYTTLAGKGPVITIIFDTAAGLEATKTKVKFKNVDVGVVEDVALSEDLQRVNVTIQMVNGADKYLTENTRFWVVRPRLTAGGVSGLGTLVSGAHVELDPQPGEPARTFVGLEIPPVLTSNIPGRKFLLRAAKRGSVSRGSAIYFRGIEVGEILGYELGEDNREVFMHAFIRDPHTQLVRKASRFWNASGVDVEVGADGLRVNTESLQSLLTGGVAFDTPLVAMSEEPAPAGTAFNLYSDRAEISEAELTQKIPYVLYFDGSVRGLDVGAPVEFRGIRVGSVTSVDLVLDTQAETAQIPVTIVIEPQRIKRIGDRFAEDPYAGMNILVEKGLRAQLRPGNLLTGQLYIGLNFVPGAPREQLVRHDDEPPRIPTIPSDLDEITRSVNSVLERIASLPLESVVDDTRETLLSIRRVVDSPDVKLSLESLRTTLQTADATMAQARDTLAATESLVGPRSQTRADLVELMKELKNAARSIRVLTDYLERHPEALIHGKGGPR